MAIPIKRQAGLKSKHKNADESVAKTGVYTGFKTDNPNRSSLLQADKHHVVVSGLLFEPKKKDLTLSAGRASDENYGVRDICGIE